MKEPAKLLFVYIFVLCLALGGALTGALLGLLINLILTILGGVPLNSIFFGCSIGGILVGLGVGVKIYFDARDPAQKTSPQLRSQSGPEVELDAEKIQLTVTSDGTTGPEWINRLEEGGYNLSDWAKQVLLSDKFNPTNGVTYQVTILKGKLFSNEDRITRSVRARADKLGLGTPHPEVACLLREKLSDEEIEKMGLTWLITMHKPIYDFDGGPRLQELYRDGDGRGLSAPVVKPDDRWSSADGFLFVASQAPVD